MNFKPKERWSFEVYPVTLLPTPFKKVKILIGSMDADTARSLADPDPDHAAYLPLLPPGTSKSADAYSYVYVQLQTGEKVVVSEAWIKPETIQKVEGVRITAVVEDESTATVELIRQMFATNGLKAVITVD